MMLNRVTRIKVDSNVGSSQSSEFPNILQAAQLIEISYCCKPPFKCAGHSIG